MEIIDAKYKEVSEHVEGPNNNQLTLLKTINPIIYAGDQQYWEDFSNEVAKLSKLIEEEKNGTREITKAEIKRIKDMYKLIENGPKAFKKELTKYINDQMQELSRYYDAQLNAIGYDVIKIYRDEKNKKENQERLDRVNEKLTKINNIIREALVSAPLIKERLGDMVPNLILPLYPKVNSADKSKNMTDDEWRMAKILINNLLTTAETHAKTIDTRLSLNSNSWQAIINYIKTADGKHIDKLPAILLLDNEAIQDLNVKELLASPDIVVNYMYGILNSAEDASKKINDIQRLIKLWLEK